jgi:hypothetical protein
MMASSTQWFWTRKILMQALACSYRGVWRREPTKVGSFFVYRPLPPERA